MSRALPVALLLLLVLGTGGLLFVLRAPRGAEVAIEAERVPEVADDPRPSELLTATTSLRPSETVSERASLAAAEPGDGAASSADQAPVSVQGLVKFSGASFLPRHAELVWTHENGSTRTCGSTNGTYWIEGLEEGAWRVVCSSPGYRPHERQLRVERDTRQQALDFALVAEHLVPVRFVDSSGLPLWGRTTEVVRNPERQHEASVRRARFPPPAIRQADVGVILTFEEPPRRLPEAMLTASMLTERRFAEGKFPDWKAAEKDLAELRDDAPGAYLYLSPWDRKRLGERLPPDADGVVELWSSRPVFASAIVRDVVLQSVRLGPGESEIVFTIERAALTELASKLVVRIVESGTGASLPGAQIGLGLAWTKGYTSDESGVVRIEGLPPGPHDVSVSAPDHASIVMTIDLPVGETKDLGTIELARAVEVQGCLLDPRGDPIQGRVRFLEAGPSDRKDVRQEVIVDVGKDGCFRETLAITRWFVEGAGGIESNGEWRQGSELGSAPLPLDLGPAPVEGLVLQLQPTTFVRVLGNDGSSPLEFAVLDASSSVVLRSGSAAERVEQLYLVPGAYRLRIGPADGPVRMRPIVITGEGTKLDLAR